MILGLGLDVGAGPLTGGEAEPMKAGIAAVPEGQEQLEDFPEPRRLALIVSKGVYLKVVSSAECPRGHGRCSCTMRPCFFRAGVVGSHLHVLSDRDLADRLAEPDRWHRAHETSSVDLGINSAVPIPPSLLAMPSFS